MSKARSLEGRGRLDLASRTWEQVLLVDDSNREALTGLARFAKQSGKSEEAARYLNRLRKVDPSNPAIARVESMSSMGEQRTRLEEAQRLAQKQDFEGAMRIYRHVFGSEPPAGGWAIAYFETEAASPGGWQDAIAGLTRLVQMYPDAEEYRLALGKLLTYRERSRAQGLELLESIKIRSELVESARQAWRQALLWDSGNVASAGSLGSYLARYPDPELASLQSREKKEPIASAEKAPRKPLQSAEGGLGYKALGAGKLGDAEQHFTAALKTSPRSASALSGLGFVRMKEERFGDAVSYFESALNSEPNNKTVADALATAKFWQHMKAGADYLNSGSTADAVSEFKAATVLRPASVEALEALAGSYLKQQRPDLACPLYQKLVAAKSENPDAWYGLIKSHYDLGRAAEALRLLKTAPSSIRDQWTSNPERLVMISFLYADSGDQTQAQRVLLRARQLSGGRAADLSPDLQMQFAGLYLRLDRPRQAAEAFSQLTRVEPARVEAWEGLLNSLLRSSDTARAYQMLQEIPSATYKAALTRASFARTIAALQEAMQRYDLSEVFLRKAIDIDRAHGKEPDIQTEIQLANTWTRTNKVMEAERLLRQITEEHPESSNAWLTLVSLLHSQKQDRSADAEIKQIPSDVLRTLRETAGFAAVEAGVYGSLGRNDEALATIRTAMVAAESENRPIPMELHLQEAWILLNSNRDPRKLYSILERYGNSPDLTATERSEFQSIWSIWSEREAAAMLRQGNAQQALSILEAASQLLPHDPKIQGTLAGTYLQGGNAEHAYSIYKQWGLKGGSAEDFSGAVGSALTVGDSTSAERWLNRGLQRFPHSSRLLALRGKEAAEHGEYADAQTYLREALAVLPPDQLNRIADRHQNEISSAGSNRNPVQVTEALGTLLVESDAGATGNVNGAETTSRIDSTEAAGLPELPRGRKAFAFDNGAIASRRGNTIGTDSGVHTGASALQSEESDEILNSIPVTESEQQSPRETSTRTPVRQTKANDRPLVRVKNISTIDPATDPLDDTIGRAAPPVLSGADADNREFALPAGPNGILMPLRQPLRRANQDSGPPSLGDQITADLQAISARNTAFFSDGGTIAARSGQAGLDKLTVEQANIDASTTIGDRVRLTLAARPTYLDSGAPDGTSSLGFGSSAKNAASPTQNAFGVAMEGQLSTQTVGLKAGITPNGFLVHNVSGGIRFNPGHGPFTIFLNRDSIRDTKLSFAGERDPGTGQIWGGVMANSVSVLGNWGTARSGFYANAGYQVLTGKNTADNSRIEATTGAYFQVLKTKEGSLTAGLNLTGMHYEKNLRYFTLGQGGYFSPQQYFLMGVPLRWTGSWKRQLQYSISGSLGVQHFHENASPYFPTSPELQARNGLYYSPFTNTGSNYSLDFRMAYQITPQWLSGGFLSINNARDYRNASAGVFLRYMFQPRPLSADIRAESIPDWRGSQPFGLPLEF